MSQFRFSDLEIYLNLSFYTAHSISWTFLGQCGFVLLSIQHHFHVWIVDRYFSIAIWPLAFCWQCPLHIYYETFTSLVPYLWKPFSLSYRHDIGVWEKVVPFASLYFLAARAPLYLYRSVSEWLMIHHSERSTRQCAHIWSDNLQLPYSSKLEIIWDMSNLQLP